MLLLRVTVHTDDSKLDMLAALTSPELFDTSVHAIPTSATLSAIPATLPGGAMMLT